MDTIVPCIFCQNGEMALWDYNVQNSLDSSYSVYCPKCLARGPKAPTQSDAVAMWNEGVQ